MSPVLLFIAIFWPRGIRLATVIAHKGRLPR